jgi:hypothetical protein
MNKNLIKEIENWLDDYGVYHYKINKDLTIDVNGHTLLNHKGLTHLPYKFNRVLGDFSVSNSSITSLKNSPNFVGQDFNCSDTEITNLNFISHHIEGSIYCTTPTLKNIATMEFKYNGSFFHCAEKEEHFLPEFINLYEKDENFGFSIELDDETLKLYLEKYTIEQNLIYSQSRKSTKIKL